MKVSKLFSRHLITWPHFFSLLLEEKHENYVKLARSIKIFWELYFLTLYLPVCFKCLTSLHHFYNVKKPTYAKYNNIPLLPKLWFVLCVLASTLLKTGLKKQWAHFTNILMSPFGNIVAEWPTEYLGTQETVYWSPKIILSQLTSGA